MANRTNKKRSDSSEEKEYQLQKFELEFSKSSLSNFKNIPWFGDSNKPSSVLEHDFAFYNFFRKCQRSNGKFQQQDMDKDTIDNQTLSIYSTIIKKIIEYNNKIILDLQDPKHITNYKHYMYLRMHVELLGNLVKKINDELERHLRQFNEHKNVIENC